MLLSLRWRGAGAERAPLKRAPLRWTLIQEDGKAQRALLKRMIAERLTATEVSALVAKLRHGDAARAPVSFEMEGVGSVDLLTTAEGKKFVSWSRGEDADALQKLWKSPKKQLWATESRTSVSR